MLSLCSCIIYRNFHFVKRKITKNYKNNYKQVTPPVFSCFRRATFPDFRLFSNSFDAIFSQNCHFGYKRIVTVRVTNGFRPRDTYILGSPGRGAGPAIAGSEGSGFSLEKPRRRRNAGLDIWGARYLRLRRKAWPLAKPDPSVSCADSSAFRGAIGRYAFARGFLLRQSVPPLIRRLRAAPSPKGKVGAQSRRVSFIFSCRFLNFPSGKSRGFPVLRHKSIVFS